MLNTDAVCCLIGNLFATRVIVQITYIINLCSVSLFMSRCYISLKIVWMQGVCYEMNRHNMMCTLMQNWVMITCNTCCIGMTNVDLSLCHLILSRSLVMYQVINGPSRCPTCMHPTDSQLKNANVKSFEEEIWSQTLCVIM